MQHVPSVYERSRDDYHYPTCWRSFNNACAPHFHSALELNYVVSGEMDALLDGKPLSVKAGDLLIVPSYAVHRFVSPSETDTIVLVVPMDYIQSFRKRMAGSQFSRQLLSAGDGAAAVAACLRVLLERPEYGGDPYIVRGQIYTILGTLLERIPLQKADQEPLHTHIRDVLAYLHNNYRHPLSLDQIASNFGYSQSRISHLFNKKVGCSIPEYINTLRSRAAANMLLEEGASITDVAMDAGFESMRTFYRAFKHCFGVTPSHYLQLSPDDLHLLMQDNGLHGKGME